MQVINVQKSTKMLHDGCLKQDAHAKAVLTRFQSAQNKLLHFI